MANYIFQGILEEQVNFFMRSFSETSPKIFVNEETGKLLHPGEYGMYREDILKNFLRLIVPYKLDINHGFILGEDNFVSNQCDVIIYERNTSPLIISAEKQRFYPIDVVAAVGEVKSNLSKSDFKEALLKLTKIKMHRLTYTDKIETFRKVTVDDGKKFEVFDPSQCHFDQIFTFLLCNKLNFNLKSIFQELDDLYTKENVPYSCRHNMIVSLEDGIIEYEKYSEKVIPYPVMGGRNLPNAAITPTEKHGHLYHFANCIFMCTSNATLLFPDIAQYMNPVNVNFVNY